jgi:hypothetical protein
MSGFPIRYPRDAYSSPNLIKNPLFGDNYINQVHFLESNQKNTQSREDRIC